MPLGCLCIPLKTNYIHVCPSQPLMQELKDILQCSLIVLTGHLSSVFSWTTCAVMRGKKTGVKTQARNDNPNLLDIQYAEQVTKALMSLFS